MKYYIRNMRGEYFAGVGAEVEVKGVPFELASAALFEKSKDKAKELDSFHVYGALKRLRTHFYHVVAEEVV